MSESRSDDITANLSALADMSSVFDKGRARVSEIADIRGMIDEGWRSRLLAAIKASGKSHRELSLAAGMGAGYVNSLFNDHKDPTIKNLMSVCEAVGVSLSYVLYGYEMSAETEEILRLLQKAPEGERDALLRLLQARHPEAG